MSVHRIHHINHLYFSEEKNSLGYTYTSHPPKKSIVLPAKGVKPKNNFIINQFVDDSARINDQTKITNLIENSGLKDPRYGAELLGAAKFLRSSGNFKTFIFDTGCPPAITKINKDIIRNHSKISTGSYHKDIILAHEKREINVDSFTLSHCDSIANVVDKLPKNDAEMIKATGAILLEKCDFKHESPIYRAVTPLAFVDNTEPQQFIDTLLSTSDNILEEEKSDL
jgi:hypothetical protein